MVYFWVPKLKYILKTSTSRFKQYWNWDKWKVAYLYVFSYFRYEEMLLSLNFKQPHDTIHKASPYTCYKNAVLGAPPMKSWTSRSEVALFMIKQKLIMPLSFISGWPIWANERQILVAWIKFRWPRLNVPIDQELRAVFSRVLSLCITLLVEKKTSRIWPVGYGDCNDNGRIVHNTNIWSPLRPATIPLPLSSHSMNEPLEANLASGFFHIT